MCRCHDRSNGAPAPGCLRHWVPRLDTTSQLAQAHPLEGDRVRDIINRINAFTECSLGLCPSYTSGVRRHLPHLSPGVCPFREMGSLVRAAPASGSYPTTRAAWHLPGYSPLLFVARKAGNGRDFCAAIHLYTSAGRPFAAYWYKFACYMLNLGKEHYNRFSTFLFGRFTFA
jgi:hypothetical protein